ncbi:alginate export family protein [Ningiella sp. W23]|uniref:alginate export family protein n=1 Tax=Ningiella sp. W23 TaxID=3023715 RepID=UPI0037579D03
MKKTLYQRYTSLLFVSSMSLLASTSANAKTVYEAVSSGDVYADFYLRYEGVSQDNALQDADALTLRTRLGYVSDSLNGWSFQVELEDSRIVGGQGDYSVPPTGYNTGIYSVIADPETTELDQGFVQYKNDGFTFKVGRQVIALDGHRHVGHVGWRQDRQTFDAATFIYNPNDKLKASYSYLTQRNRIFAEERDLDSKDHLLNISYQSGIGKLVAYSYLLEVDNETDNALDTFGFSIDGKKAMDSLSWLYYFEYASQRSELSGNEFDADFIDAKLGLAYQGVTVKLSYESLGSDDGQYGFAFPLSTLHKFNGWADLFLATPAEGLVDTNVTVSTQALGGKWLARYHTYEADEASETVDDLGSEINLQYTTKIFKDYGLGIKYANYSGDSNRPDTDKLWIWLTTKF